MAQRRIGAIQFNACRTDALPKTSWQGMLRAAKKITFQDPSPDAVRQKRQLSQTESNEALIKLIPNGNLVEVCGRRALFLEEGQFKEDLINVLTSWLAEQSQIATAERIFVRTAQAPHLLCAFPCWVLVSLQLRQFCLVS